MTFSKALELLKDGCALTRTGWNGKGQCIHIEFVQPGESMTMNYISFLAGNGAIVPWVASQTDLLSNDWELVQ